MKNIFYKINLLIMLAMIGGQKVFAAGLVPCEGAEDCNFDTFIKLLNNVMNFVIFRLPLFLLVILLAWSGIQLLMYRDRPEAIKNVKKNLLNLFIGYILVLGAYVIVKTFITILAGQELTFKVFFN